MKYTCQQIQEKITAMIDGNIAEADIEIVNKHLDTCSACRAYRDGLETDDKALAEYSASLDEVVTNLKSTVNALLGDEQVPVGKAGHRRFSIKTSMSITAAAAAIIVVALISMDLFPPLQQPAKHVASAESNGEAPSSSAAEPRADGMIALEIEIPAETLTGTPKSMANIENLEEPRPKGQQREAILVPAGTTNVALNKPVTSTSLSPIFGALEDITDGDKSGDSYVELDPFEQNITIDLGASYEIYAIALWHYHKETAVYFDVVIQTADDPDFIMNVQTLFNNDIDNTHGLGTGEEKNYIESYEGKLIDAKGVTGRYVRCYSSANSSNDMNHYIEVEVFGKPVE